MIYNDVVYLIVKCVLSEFSYFGFNVHFLPQNGLDKKSNVFPKCSFNFPRLQFHNIEDF